MDGKGGNSANEFMDMLSMQMTFYWGMASDILVKGWPGHPTGMYCISIRMLLTVKHGIRVGLLYLVMLAVMSFNVGVLIAAVSGHTLGFFFFGGRTISTVNPQV
ncbi:hypothetical protein MKW94_004082 [Papaver nudicaule]|uniref:Copper transport protein n=1 Tax=Papaver nudicaule TaxID=74823 RepID=A0AA41RYZ2_PAPNU|nr:hypothetical protein [Papaver nudicaule]